MDKCCLHSLTSTGHSTCRQTVKVACWLLTSVIILFCCWAVDYNYNASSSTTQTLKTSCIGQQDYVTVNSHHNSTFYTAVGSGRGLMSSHYSIYAKWLVHCCFTQTHYSNVPVPIAFFVSEMTCYVSSGTLNSIENIQWKFHENRFTSFWI